jgi:hypothetical protein
MATELHHFPRLPSSAPRSLLLVPLLLLAEPGAAQAPAPDGPGEGPRQGPFHGVVVDEDTGAPVEGAQVYLPEEGIGYLTRADGRFRIPEIPGGSLQVEVRRIGYAPMDVWMDFEAPFPPLEIRLVPDPVLLEGFQVVTDRFERRRRAVATTSRVFGESRLLTSSALDAADLVRREMGVILGSCPRHIRSSWCVLSRGRPTPPSVYIDEAPAIGGMDQLAMYRPHELYMVEVFGGGRHIRAYTHQFMEWAARNRLAPIPIF